VVQEPKQVIRTKLKAAIFGLRYGRLENKYLIGEKLWQLQQLHGKPGHGTFLEDLFELGIATTTAYRWIEFYQRVAAGYDPTPVRMTKAQQNKLFANLEGDPPEKVTPEMIADPNRKKLAKAIAAAKEHVEKAKERHKTKPGAYNVKVVFTKMERTAFHPKYLELGIKEVSKLVYKAVMDAKAE
jgi:hypothetical protein